MAVMFSNTPLAIFEDKPEPMKHAHECLIEGNNSLNCLSYVLITPARNESKFIKSTIDSVITQTVLPLKWVIVSDGSTDGTDDIIQEYAAFHRWIEFLRMPERGKRHFAGKVYAFKAGYERVKDLEYDVIGSLDADLSFDEEYFAFLLSKFAANPRLGVAGTPFIENEHQYDYRFTNIEHVSGACQLFRKECFEEIGGYKPIEAGGIDWVAVTTARMREWHTRTFTEKVIRHHRTMGTGQTRALASLFALGKKDYYLGGHPAWQVCRSIYQMSRKPYVIGGVLILAGYLWACLRRIQRPISKELITFCRKEQVARLLKIFAGK
jgi:glycosyltransferase involved in cell wall biosynthesis